MHRAERRKSGFPKPNLAAQGRVCFVLEADGNVWFAHLLCLCVCVCACMYMCVCLRTVINTTNQKGLETADVQESRTCTSFYSNEQNAKSAAHYRNVLHWERHGLEWFAQHCMDSFKASRRDIPEYRPSSSLKPGSL